MGIIKYNDISTEDLGIIIQFIPTYEFPNKDYESVHIPGKNGDILIDNGSFQNVERTYSIAKTYKTREDFIKVANKITTWLFSADGYARLEDSYEPDYYRMAMYKNNGNMTNFYDVATALEITFDCKPQRWLISGDEEITVQNGVPLPKNPTNYDSMPIFEVRVHANTIATINVGSDYQLQIDKFASVTDIIIDCENMECYYGDTLYNSKVKITKGNGFPKLAKDSQTTITYSGVSSLKVKPRWWTI